MKKIIIILLCSLILFSTVSCNKKNTEEAENKTQQTSVTETPKTTMSDVTDAVKPTINEPQVDDVLPETNDVLFVGDFSEFEFYLGDVHVFGKIDNSKVEFTYDSNYFDQNIETELVKIASTVNSFEKDDIKYTVSKGQLVFYYTENIDPNKAIDTFFNLVFNLD